MFRTVIFNYNCSCLNNKICETIYCFVNILVGNINFTELAIHSYDYFMSLTNFDDDMHFSKWTFLNTNIVIYVSKYSQLTNYDKYN